MILISGFEISQKLQNLNCVIFTDYMPNMWYLLSIILSTILVFIAIIEFKLKRRKILTDKIPGPGGSLFIGSLPLFLQGPEKLITNTRNLYQM